MGFLSTWAGLYRALDNVCTHPVWRCPWNRAWASLRLTWIAWRRTPERYDAAMKLRGAA